MSRVAPTGDLAERLARNLVAFSKASGLTRAGVARRAGVSYDTVRFLERQEVGSSPDTLQGLARAFERDVADLIAENPSPQKWLKSPPPPFVLKFSRGVSKEWRAKAEDAVAKLVAEYRRQHR